MTSNYLHKKKTRYYIPEYNEKDSFKLDQTIIYNKKVLKHVISLDYQEKPITEEPNLLAEDWYPLANSYYLHTEDVDPLEKSNYLLAEDIPSDFLECMKQRPVQDCFSEQAVQQRYLQSKPVSFIIFGKPGIGEEDLGKKIADLWCCEYITPQTLIEEEIAGATDIGKAIEFNMRQGRAVEIDVILRLIEKRVKCESAKHKGFLLCGVPLIPNDLYEEEPISTPSTVFNAKETLREIVDLALDVAKMIDPNSEPIINTDVHPSDQSLNDFTTTSERKLEMPRDLGSEESFDKNLKIGCDYDSQMNFLLNLMENPFVIIYIKCSTTDVLQKRDSYRFNVKTKGYYDMQLVNFYQKMLYHYLRSEDYPLDDIFESEYLLLDVNQLHALVTMPCNFRANVATQVDWYNKVARKFIEKKVLMHNPQFIIKLDGRINIARNYRIVRARLRTLPLQRVILPKRLVSTDSFILQNFDDSDWDSQFYGEDDNRSEKNPTIEDYFNYFSTVDNVHNRYPWKWSAWGAYCPVALHAGELRRGQINYNIRFMNKIFFLSDHAAFLKFYRNPRPYLLAPYPKSPCRIYIFGPRNSGRTAVARCLGYYFDCQVLTPEEILRSYIKEKEANLKEAARERAKDEAMAILNQKRIDEAAEREKARQEAVEHWFLTVSVLIKQYLWHLGKETNQEIPECFMTRYESIFFMDSQMNFISNTPEFKSLPDIVVLTEMLKAYNILEESSDPEVWKKLLAQREELLVFVPENIRHRIKPCPALVFDEFVMDYISDAVKKIRIYPTDVNIEDAFLHYMHKCHTNSWMDTNNCSQLSSWIIDGMLCNLNLIEKLSPIHMGSEIIVLDDSPTAEYLLKKFVQNEYPFPDYKSYFKSVNRSDIAQRSSSTTSTKSYKEGLMRNILNDLLESEHFNEELEGEGNSNRKTDAYKQEILKFREQWKIIKHFYAEHDCRILEINVSNKTHSELFNVVIKKIEDNYRVLPWVMTTPSREEELRIYGDGKKINEEVRLYGDTFHFCPVTFYEKFVLWKGKEKYAVRFDNQVYLMSSETAMRKFVYDPETYLLKEPQKRYPPVRVCVIGYLKSGKTTIAHMIEKNLGINYVSYESLIQQWFNLDSRETFETLKIDDVLTHEELHSYIFANGSLPHEKLQNINDLWHEEPHKSIGFVFDDFPKRESDIEYMISNQFIPDIIIQLACPSAHLIANILEDEISAWKDKIEKKVIWEEQNKTVIVDRWEKRKQRFDELIEESREKRYITKKQQTQKKGAEDVLVSMSQVSFDSVAEQEDIDEINRILDEELPLITYEEDIGESLDVIVQKLERTLMESFHVEEEYLTKIKAICERERIPFKEIPLDVDDVENTKIRVFRALDEYKYREDLFERCYDVSSVDVANKFISVGYFFLSKFAKTCPVQYFENENPIQAYLPQVQKQNIFPVIHRSYIYFVYGNENRLKFKKNPLKYINLDFQFPLISVTVGVIGPPKCGKTLLSKRLKDEYGFKIVSRRMAIRHVLNYLPYSDLSKKMDALLRKGEQLTVNMVMHCVEAMVYDARIATQGVVYDGYPNDIDEVKALASLGLIPNLVIDLVADKQQSFECFDSDVAQNYCVVKYGKHFFEHLYDVWRNNAEDFRVWFDKEYQIRATIPIDKCNWSVFNRSRKLINAVIFEVKHYMANAYNDWPLRLANMRVTPLEFVERRSHYKSFCPVCLHFSNVLVSGGNPPDRTGLIHYRMFYYWLCSEHEELFLKTPDRFLPPYNHNLMPTETPNILTSIDKPVENKYCVVCYKNHTAQLAGDVMFAIEYREKIYLFDKKYCMDEFFKTPNSYVYHDFAIPNVDYPKLDYRELPVLGMLEQFVAKYVVKSLCFVTKKRPVVPGLSIQKSAAIGIGICLKIYNERLKKEFKPYYQEGYQVFCDRCDHLISYLDKMKCVINPYLHYEEPLPEFRPVVESEESSTTSESVTTVVTDIIEEYIVAHNIS